MPDNKLVHFSQSKIALEILEHIDDPQASIEDLLLMKRRLNDAKIRRFNDETFKCMADEVINRISYNVKERNMENDIAATILPRLQPNVAIDD